MAIIPYGTYPIISSKNSKQNREINSNNVNGNKLVVAWLLLCYSAILGFVSTAVM